MITLDLPEPQMHPVILRSDDLRTMSVHERPGDLTAALSLGAFPRPVTAADVAEDTELREFMEREGKNFRFHGILMKCSFHAAADEPFEEAWLKVELERTDGVEGARPVAWSMDPLKASTTGEMTRSSSLKAELKFNDLGVEAGGEKSRTLPLELIHVAAYGLLGSAPFWEFRRTEACAIDNNYQLKMIVRVPRHIQAVGRITMQANVRRRRFGLLPYTAEFPDQASSTILLT